MHKILTTDQTLLKNPEYTQIRDTLLRLANNGVIRMGQGWCVSMSDMIYTLLKQQGISAKMVECQAVITVQLQDGSEHVNLIGFEEPDNPGQISSHVVLVTATAPPMIIDASIGHILPQDQSVIVDACLATQTHRVFAEIRTDSLKITYQEKAQPKIPLTHQVSVLDRIVTDQKIFSDISMLKKLNYIGIALSIFAAINVVGKILGVL
jgi:hypothetical protein